MTGSYNYERFEAGHYDLGNFRGPAVGTKATDFAATTLDGQAVQLSAYFGRSIVLEMGSVTCPIYQSRRGGMESLARAYPDVQFLVLYVREAHPGQKVTQHQTDADKRARAQGLKDDFGESRTILVDDLAGTAHKIYGEFPNSVFVIDKDGAIVFRSDWNDTAAVRKVLRRLAAGKPVGRVISLFKPANPLAAKRTFAYAGKGSGKDFFASLPSLMKQNLILRNLRSLLGR
ncbi:MAG: redoxin domain-containing protein [Proteobacteria bacterium]|nr:redoxin domain-containing protein [Pseudomonadota bacterium]